MLPLTNTFPFAFIFLTTLGVLMHDTQIDQAAKIAIVNPANFSDFAVADAASKSHEHVHVERVSMSGQGHSVRANSLKIPPRDDDRRYIQSKKSNISGGDSVSLWPSV